MERNYNRQSHLKFINLEYTKVQKNNLKKQWF
jgi:hypothetical protein